MNNINLNKSPNYQQFYGNNNINEIDSLNNYPNLNKVYDTNKNHNKFIIPIKSITQKNSNSYINFSIELEKAAKEEKKVMRL